MWMIRVTPMNASHMQCLCMQERAHTPLTQKNVTYSILCHVRTSHVPWHRMDFGSCLTCECFASHIECFRKDVHTRLTHIQMNHVRYERVMSHDIEWTMGHDLFVRDIWDLTRSYVTWNGLCHARASHVPHVNEFCHEYSVLAPKCAHAPHTHRNGLCHERASHVPCVDESCHTHSACASTHTRTSHA